MGIGIDLMPIATFVSSAKSEWTTDPEALREAARGALQDRTAPTIPPPFLRETRRQFSPPVLRSLLRLKQNVRAAPEGASRTLLTLALASILIDSSNLKRSPCLGYTRKPGLTAETPLVLFRAAVERMCEDLLRLQHNASSWGPPRMCISGTRGRSGSPPNRSTSRSRAHPT